MSSPISLNDHIYGLDARTKDLMCVEVKTGKIIWREGGFGLGHLTLAKNTLIVLTDTGKLVLVKATPAKYVELAATQGPEGKYWTDPILANGQIYIRNWTGTLTCFDVK